jgi:hypothetical protein
MPGAQYTQDELRSMSPDAFNRARDNGFLRSLQEIELPEPAAGYGTRWAAKASGSEEDFTCPSGERCRLRTIPVEDLLSAGILDKVTRLEGLADALIQKAEGAPPTVDKMPNAEEFAELLDVINTVVILAVVEPTVTPDDSEAEGVKVSWIDLDDRAAIMEHALRGVRKLDKFRHAG